MQAREICSVAVREVMQALDASTDFAGGAVIYARDELAFAEMEYNNRTLLNGFSQCFCSNRVTGSAEVLAMGDVSSSELDRLIDL